MHWPCERLHGGSLGIVLSMLDKVMQHAGQGPCRHADVRYTACSARIFSQPCKCHNAAHVLTGLPWYHLTHHVHLNTPHTYPGPSHIGNTCVMSRVFGGYLYVVLHRFGWILRCPVPYCYVTT